MKNILIVDDDIEIRNLLKEALIMHGYTPVESADGKSAIKEFNSQRFLAVLLDLNMPDMNGLETMQHLREIDPEVPIIFVTAYGDIPTAVEAIKMGAYDFIIKPPKIDRLMITLKNAIQKSELEKKVKRLDAAVESSLEWMLGRSDAMKRVIEQIKQVAWTDFSVILQGETGSGKSFIARAIHNQSRRASEPFITVDLGVIPETLVESELFGHERGAFTGAEKKKAGLFEIANKGTIFIDDLENISPYVQSKLLRVVEEKRFFPLGSTKAVETDVRIIAATNKDIKSLVAEKKFREDLFFRLGEFIIDIPPLRARIEDIGFLARRFATEAAEELNKQIRNISEDALRILEQYPWPGNVRELKNVIRRAVLICEEDIIEKRHIEFLIEPEREKKESIPLMPLKELSAIAVRDVEKRAIEQALKVSGGNKTKAASILQIDYKTLLTKIKEYGLQ
ncbi:MAG: sigma-54 dependent transcriptional regulator [Thermodesulfovibrionales bacterium]|nr:sigma-54 dependent transcriptional regulator [Thermodesulfovibrionales bacterium]